jgi:hypothetical protein
MKERRGRLASDTAFNGDTVFPGSAGFSAKGKLKRR